MSLYSWSWNILKLPRGRWIDSPQAIYIHFLFLYMEIFWSINENKNTITLKDLEYMQENYIESFSKTL